MIEDRVLATLGNDRENLGFLANNARHQDCLGSVSSPATRAKFYKSSIWATFFHGGASFGLARTGSVINSQKTPMFEICPLLFFLGGFGG